MQCMRSLFCCGSRAQRRAAEPAEGLADALRPEDHDRTPDPVPAPALAPALIEGLETAEALRAEPSTPQDEAERPPRADDEIEDVPRVHPGGRWRTLVNCSDAGVQAAFRDGISVTLSGGLALLMRAGAMMAAAQSQENARAIGGLAIVGVLTTLRCVWPRAVELIVEPTSLRESVGAKRVLTALPFAAFLVALGTTPDENSAISMAVTVLFRQWANLMRDSCTQTQAGAWGSIEACTADGLELTYEQTRQLMMRRAAIATVVYGVMGWLILNGGADWLDETLEVAKTHMKDDAIAGFPGNGRLYDESADHFLARDSYPYNLTGIASRYIQGVVLEALDGYNSGGLAPALAALSLGLRFKYKQGLGPKALCVNLSSEDGKRGQTLERILNNASMRIGLGMGGDISSAVGLRAGRLTQWRKDCRLASSILNGLTEVRSFMIERGLNARREDSSHCRTIATAAADSAARESLREGIARRTEHELAQTPGVAVAWAEESNGADPSPDQSAAREDAMNASALEACTVDLARAEPAQREAQVERFIYTIGFSDSVGAVQSARTQTRRRQPAAATPGR